MRAIGDKVQLRYDCGYGSLSGTYLYEHGFSRDLVLITAVRPDPHSYDYTVELPDGSHLDIDEKDIA
jgi:hypothetical protein